MPSAKNEFSVKGKMSHGFLSTEYSAKVITLRCPYCSQLGVFN